MSIIRSSRPEANYTVLENSLIYNSDLDWRELGLLVYLLSKPDNWTVSVAQLEKEKASGRKSIFSALNLLKWAGYVEMVRKAQGGVDYIIYDKPLSLKGEVEKPLAAKPLAAKPLAAKSPLIRTDPLLTPEKESKDEIARSVAYHLNSKILTENPSAKTKPENWIADIDKAMRIDGRSYEDLINMIDWIYTGDMFWTSNILSGEKLRKHYDSIFSQKSRARTKVKQQQERLPNFDDDLPAWAKGHDLRQPRAGESYQQYRRELENQLELRKAA